MHLVCASGPRGYGHVRALLEKYGRVYAGFVHPNPIQTKKTCVNYLLGQPTSEQHPHRHTAHARSHHLRPILTRAPASLPLQPGLHHARARTRTSTWIRSCTRTPTRIGSRACLDKNPKIRCTDLCVAPSHHLLNLSICTQTRTRTYEL